MIKGPAGGKDRQMADRHGRGRTCLESSKPGKPYHTKPNIIKAWKTISYQTK